MAGCILERSRTALFVARPCYRVVASKRLPLPACILCCAGGDSSATVRLIEPRCNTTGACPLPGVVTSEYFPGSACNLDLATVVMIIPVLIFPARSACDTGAATAGGAGTTIFLWSFKKLFTSVATSLVLAVSFTVASCILPSGGSACGANPCHLF